MLGACRVPVFIDRLLLPGSGIRNTGAGGDVDRARVHNYGKGELPKRPIRLAHRWTNSTLTISSLQLSSSHASISFQRFLPSMSGRHHCLPVDGRIHDFSSSDSPDDTNYYFKWSSARITDMHMVKRFFLPWPFARSMERTTAVTDMGREEVDHVHAGEYYTIRSKETMYFRL